jgi:hypothetical protein
MLHLLTSGMRQRGTLCLLCGVLPGWKKHFVQHFSRAKHSFTKQARRRKILQKAHQIILHNKLRTWAGASFHCWFLRPPRGTLTIITIGTNSLWQLLISRLCAWNDVPGERREDGALAKSPYALGGWIYQQGRVRA